MVIQDLAVCRVVTRVFNGAGVLAVSVDTGLLRRTIRVVGAVHGRAQLIGVAVQTGWARASGQVAGTRAQGVGPTRLVVGSADRGAFIEATGVVVGTVRIHKAFHSLTVQLGITVITGLYSITKHQDIKRSSLHQ